MKKVVNQTSPANRTPVKKNTVNKANNKNKNAQKKKKHTLTEAEYYDLCQIDWVPFDPYAD